MATLTGGYVDFVKGHFSVRVGIVLPFTSSLVQMNVDVACPYCSRVYTVTREVLGKRAKCANCGKAFTIAEASNQPENEWQTVTSSGDIPPQIQTAARSKPASNDPDFPEINTGEFFGFERDRRKPRFPALRMIARSYELMALVVVVVALFSIIAGIIYVVMNDPLSVFQYVVGAIFLLMLTAILTISLLSVAQSIRLGLQIEQNTRDTFQAIVEQSKQQPSEAPHA